MDEYQFSYEDYKKRVRNHGLSVYIIGFFIILLIGAAVLLWPKEVENKNKTSYYFVEIDNFLVYKDANALAGTIQKELGAGYIYFDSSYHVFAAFYPDENSATAVADNLLSDYPSARVFKIDCNVFSSHNNLTENQNEAVKNTILKNDEIINKIYENILNFDKNEININILKQNFTNFCSDYNKIYENLKSSFTKNSKYYKAVENILNINNSLASFNNYVDNNELHKLKYNLIKIVVEHCAFVNSF